MTTAPFPQAAFGTARRNVPRVLSRAKSMHSGLVANPSLFVSPPINPADFLALIDDLDDAQIASASRTSGLCAVRNVKRNTLWTAMQALRLYVQALCDKVSATEAWALIEAAGMVVADSSAHGKALLQALFLAGAGLVHLIANASMLTGRVTSKKTLFNWQWSDDDRATWNNLAATTYAEAFVPNLPAGKTYWFRVSVTLGKVTGEWSQAVNLAIH